MTRTLSSALIAFLIAVPAVPAGAAPTPEALVREQCRGMTQRINKHDLAGVRTYFSPQIRVKGTRGSTQGYRTVVRSMAQTFRRFPKFRTEMNVDKAVVKGDKAYLTARYARHGIGKKSERGRCNMVWKRTNGRWLLAMLSGA